MLALLTVVSLVQFTPRASAATSAAVQISGLDAHDGMVVKYGSKFYLYGTRYGCGFKWMSPSPWCGFGVWTASTRDGPWTFVRKLFLPSSMDAWAGMTWQQVCGDSGRGCFNPRMVRRTDGVWILSFNAPYDYQRTRANPYYFMGCAGPAGPCGPGAGPYGSLHKPRLWSCYGTGDFSIFVDQGVAYMACTMWDLTLSMERLDYSWTNGVQGQGQQHVAGVTNVESPGLVKVDSRYVLTYSLPNCGFCVAGTGWATSSTPMGSYTVRQPASSQSTCGGQPRTAFYLGDHAYQWIDQWSDSWNQAKAAVVLSRISFTPKLRMPCP